MVVLKKEDRSYDSLLKKIVVYHLNFQSMHFPNCSSKRFGVNE